MKRFRLRFFILGLAFVLILSGAGAFRIDAATDTETVMSDSSEETAEDTVNGTAVGMMVSGMVMVVVVMSFLGRVEKKKKKYLNSNLSIS